ncbi:hypothetical protein CANTEDRAFT_117432 [Yamadazyma tenuis ATCC 10573]|uniref:Phosphatidylserine decarboxylase proenzyme 2 n=1 Tax=Candida tenuis (strain ATCC 10573 / BCRC 21748 / CBS 615 / JCM 9827 / NBRC 10315 / NRRL Y-1498 / VKM Y-70) TaxID=590646 RepID=G3AWA7_CANTC|nr:uncharacterized protein CANTEDRAFT_117432 [Yamadazyma tenuis ATCC 10573]EGV66499.1 hypothetical protein CANTEDRAFT_117432 [Yamadazyma tenuis ATCC 10573]
MAIIKRRAPRSSSQSSAATVSPTENLFINIHANRAADLIEESRLDIASRITANRTNPILLANLNGQIKKTKRKLSSNNPSWDQILSLPLKPYDRSSVVTLSVWDKHRGYKNYLGELRIDLASVFGDGDNFTPKTELKWYKLYSNDSQKHFVTGSLLLAFELVVKQKKGLAKRSQTVEDFKAMDLTSVAAPSNKKLELLNDWKKSLIYSDDAKALSVNDQGFYSDSGDVSDISDVSLSEADAASLYSDTHSQRSNELSEPQHNLSPEFDIKEQNHMFSTDDLTTDFDESDAVSLVDNEGGRSDPQTRRTRRFKHRKPKHPERSKFEIKNRKVDGVLFLEVVSCSDLPPVRRLTGMGRFDMDPFVVVTFGKQTFRTSWKRHNLNPIFNERLAFEILKQEKSFEVHFLVLDKDRFSLHDDVASVSIPLKDLTKTATAAPKSMYLRPAAEASGESLELTQEEFTDSELPSNKSITIVENNNLVETMEKRIIRKKLKLKYSDTSRFKTMDLALNLVDDKYKNKYSPKLKVRVRYETYENLRRSFWERLLDQYNLADSQDTNIQEKTYDYIELISLLDTLGCENSDEIVTKFFAKYGRSPWGGDTLQIEQICECLEEHIAADDTNNKLFEIEQCPNCLKKRFINKHDVDIVTHFAICGSKDWSLVDKLLVSSYVTPQLASKRWFTKVLIKLSYGKYQLGSNSANILVQDRMTGIILEEKMGVYVRLGIRLLYKGLDKARTKRIRSLLYKLSVKQGTKFDDPASKHDIPSFVRFHKLDLSECLDEDLSKYATFNEFFYRRLKPGARTIEREDDDRVVISPADCRCVVFDSVVESTKLWIKGRNFTIAKLFNGNFYGLENKDIYRAENCAVAVFRLAPQDYHRFHCPVSGVIKKIKFIEGEYYTVNPMAIRSELDVFGENVRALIAIETETFGTVVMIPVGAMMVGSTILTRQEGEEVKKGEEMGYFKFGGSTVILLFERNKFKFDSDLVENSRQQMETLVRVGQSVGHSPGIEEVRRDHMEFSKLTESTRKNLIRVITGGDLADVKEFRSWEASNLTFDDDLDSMVEYVSDYDEEEEKDEDEEGIIY